MKRSNVPATSAVVAAMVTATILALLVAGLAGAAPGFAGAPGAPGDKAVWTPADKDGFGTSTTAASKV
jgi:glucoamylase